MKSIKIYSVSDTHTFHPQLKVPECDIMIFAGDASNAQAPIINEPELRDFLNWFDKLPIKYKCFVAGNHDTALACGLIKIREEYPNIIYLEHESVNIKGINIFGSPYTPTFGCWSFMKAPHKLDQYWQQIPENTDILVTHGPPKGILDLSLNRNNELEFCGDKFLLNHVKRVKPKYHFFGHIHDFKQCINKGMRKLDDLDCQFWNVSAVTDNKFDLGVTSNGALIEYKL